MSIISGEFSVASSRSYSRVETRSERLQISVRNPGITDESASGQGRGAIDRVLISAAGQSRATLDELSGKDQATGLRDVTG